MFVRSAAAGAGAARQQNLPLQRLLSSTTLSSASAWNASFGPTPASSRHIASNQNPNPRPRRRNSFRGLASLERHLATAVEEYRPDAHFQVMPKSIYDLRPISGSPLVITDERRTRFVGTIGRRDGLGLHSGVQEMLCVFDACIQVGRLERAAQVLKRLQTGLRPQDQMELHDRFLEARLVQMQEAAPGTDLGDDLHEWFEVQIRSNHLPHTHDTIALLLKASLIGSPGSMPLRVKRYMSMLERETALESLYIGGLLEPSELTTISRICPEYIAQVEVDEYQALEAEAGEDSHFQKVEKSTSGPVPQVLVTPQKGGSLKMLRHTLAVLDEIPQGSTIQSLAHAEQKEIQTRLEKDSAEAAIRRWKEENQSLLDMGLNSGLSRPSLSTKLYTWQKDLEARLTRELELITASESAENKSPTDLERCEYGPFLRLCSPRRLAATTILSTLSALSMAGVAKGIPLVTLVNHIARTVEEEIRVHKLQEHMTSNSKLARRQTLNPRRLRALAKSRRAPTDAANPGAAQDETAPSAMAEFGWTSTIRSQVGCALFQALMESAKLEVVREHPETKEFVTQVQPAFTHITQLRKGKKIIVAMPNQELIDSMVAQPNAHCLTRHLPMVVEPQPWSKFDKGGFLVMPAELVRIKSGEADQKMYAEAALARGDMDQVLRGLDVLGRTAWSINRSVFDVMIEAWNSGGEIANIPALHPVLDIPPEPEAGGDPSLRRNWMRTVKVAENAKAGLHSERCHMNLQLEIARAFLGQTFYFPHNVDFRGRAYPIPAYLNHMGADHVRGLLMFAKGKPLGEEGLRWLKVHLANLYGLDKASLGEREQFVMDNLDNIRESVSNPLKGKRWWLKAEDPWQCLAACFDLVGALDLPDPTQYISRLPVHQDGTCNGLQHYAALGGDTWGAEQVNLVPGDRPADVYSAVAASVEDLIAKDAEKGDPLAILLKGKIVRKVVKQTVMTNVYGVTRIGARRQVEKQLEALYPDLPAQAGLDYYLPFATYITNCIFAVLGTMFRGARDIQEWLGEIGARVCMSVTPEQMAELFDLPTPDKTEPAQAPAPVVKGKKARRQPLFHSSIVWTTPLRMPVVQPYRRTKTSVVQTCLANLHVMKPDPFDPVNKRKQLQAFPPNFIHSLDASHMLLSALECDRHGLTFAAVHDSFWTHACDIPAMSNVLRDAFIRIHQEDVISRLLAEFQARYKGSYYLVTIKGDTEVAKRISSLRRSMTSKTMMLELKTELERRRLLQSSDPAEVQKGKEMVTPTSIYEECAQASDKVNEFEEARAEEDDAESDGDVAMSPSEDVEQQERAFIPFRPEWWKYADKETGDFSRTIAKKDLTQKTVAYQRTTQVWAPLTFPDIPKKGDFDVSTLKDSKYFFS
ncbi:DNA/RNA polymerase [Rhypophila decipiens]|uniref:DNA-directed RNA polymerase n=1 Tax=Rhypophila decipiens TaxID=261697 RepID=A0AAN6Y706_9PEZI|nr:DNA/RNA polymerase [Rhypophila decipiens]